MPTKNKYDILISKEDMAHRLRELSFFERMAIEESTRGKQSSIVNCYQAFCRSAGLQARPVTFEAMGLYSIQYCHRFGNTARTLPVIYAHVKRWDREEGGCWMDALSEARLTDVAAGLAKFDRTPSARKLPITHKVMADIQAAADMASISHYQHVTMSRIARDALLRGAELIKLRRADVAWSPDGKEVTITVIASKANKVGPPEQIILKDYGISSGVAFLREYSRIMGFTTAQQQSLPLWPMVSPEGRIDFRRPMSKRSFISLARTLLAKAGYPAKAYAGHSYRSGGATDLWDSHRCRDLVIKLHGRWKSDAYRLYIRDNPHHTAEEVAYALAFFDEATRD